MDPTLKQLCEAFDFPAIGAKFSEFRPSMDFEKKF
jgi:hypothetical protein